MIIGLIVEVCFIVIYIVKALIIGSMEKVNEKDRVLMEKMRTIY